MLVEEERSPETREGARARRSGVWWVAAGAVVLAGVVFWLVKDALLDDSYITLSYARGVVERGEWGMIPGEVANSATSPGNVLLLALVTWVVGSPVWALGVVFIACALVLVLALRRAALDRGLPGWTGVVTAALALTRLARGVRRGGVGVLSVVVALVVEVGRGGGGSWPGRGSCSAGSTSVRRCRTRW